MTDPLSPISDFYPSNIKLDINNQPYAWMGVNLLPFVDADRVRKIVDIVMKKGELTEEDKKLNKRGDNILITRDLNVSNYFQGDLSIHALMNTYGKFLKEDNEIKGIHPGNVNKDKSQIYIFKKKNKKIKHCSKILKGVKKDPKCILEDNLDTYNKRKFNGKNAIEIVEEVLGTQYDDIEGKVIRETFDRYGNNNMGLPDDPQLKFLLMKKRERENEHKSHQATVINNKSNTKNSINISHYQNNKEEMPKEETIPLKEDEDEKEKKENAKTKRKFQEKVNNEKDKNQTNENKKIDIGLYNAMFNIMSGFNNSKKKKK